MFADKAWLMFTLLDGAEVRDLFRAVTKLGKSLLYGAGFVHRSRAAPSIVCCSINIQLHWNWKRLKVHKSTH